MIKELLKVADKLDEMGLDKDASKIDGMIKKLAQLTNDPGVYDSAAPLKHIVDPGDTMTSMTERHSASTGKTVADNIALNKHKDPTFDADKLQPGQAVWLWCDGACEAN